MKANPFLEEMLQLITNFLRKTGYENEAQLLEGQFAIPQWVERDNPLIKKGLNKIIKEFANNNLSIRSYYENRCNEEEEGEQDEEKSRSRKKKEHKKKSKDQSPLVKTKATSPVINQHSSPRTRSRGASPQASSNPSWMAKFEKPKRLQDLNSPRQNNQLATKQFKQKKDQEKIKTRKKQAKKEVIESSDFQSEEDSFELEPKKKQKKNSLADKKEIKLKEKEKTLIVQKKQEVINQRDSKVVDRYQEWEKDMAQPKYNQNRNGYKNSFSRINPSEVGPIKDELRDNSFQAKGKYGQAADEWGQFGFDKLKDARGDSFKKTKGKLKNRAFQGALMDINKINSIPIL